MSAHPSRAYAPALWGLASLFFLRVLGQVLVAFFDVRFLPPMPRWYSGLLPYPVLLPVQILILLVQVRINLDFSTGRGFFVVPRPALGRFLRWFSYVYFAAMALRYAVTRTHAIPVFFHWVLAAYLFALGHFHTRREMLPGDAPERRGPPPVPDDRRT